MNKVLHKQGSYGESLAVGSLFLFFAVKAVFFAFRIRERVFPDEVSWFGMAQVFSRSLLPPVDSFESYSLGLITHIPNLYFFLMGKILTLNVLPVDDLLFLRLVNVFFSLLTILYAWRLVQLVSSNLATRLLFMTMLTNTIMFTFMAGAVSYDNFATLLAVLSLYYLFIFFRKRDSVSLLLFGIFVLAGTLTKNVMIPYGAGLCLLLIWHEIKEHALTSPAICSLFCGFSWQKCLLFLLLGILLVCNIKLYVGNKVEYGVLIPDMGQVLPVEHCLKNRLFARNYAARQFKAGKLTLLDAQRLALQIRDPGDRGFAWTMIENAKKEKAGEQKERMGRLAYSIEWVQYMASRTYGVAGHLMMHKSDPQLYPYYAFGVLAVILSLVKIGAARFTLSGVGGLSIVSIFYILVLMQVVNYRNYVQTGFVGLALTGRYLFPVMVPVYLWVASALMDRMPKWWQFGAGIAIACFFVYSEFPWFVKLAGPEWFF